MVKSFYKIRRVRPFCFLLWVFILASFSNVSFSHENGKILSISVVRKDANYAAKIVLSHSINYKPRSFSVVSPSKIIVDLPGIETNRPTYVLPLNMGDFDKVYVAQLNEKTRLVFTLSRFHAYKIQREGDQLILTLFDQNEKPLDTRFQKTEKNNYSSGSELKKIDFRKGETGSGLIVLNTDVGHTAIHVDHLSDGLSVFLPKVEPRDALLKSYDVSDFSTPVEKFIVLKKAGGTLVRVYVKGPFEDKTFESLGKVIIELNKLETDSNSLDMFKKRVFYGKHMSLHFQDTPIQNVLQAIADFTGINILVTNKVTGNLTIRLDDVPWDQALSIVLESRNLGMRKNGNIIFVGTRGELLESEKQYIQSQRQMNDLAHTVSVVFHLNYQKADLLERMLNEKDKILSDRGSVIVDKRTNQIFVRDIPSKIKEVEKFIKAVDIPVSQVLIEARIVEANNTFNRSLGIRLGNIGSNETMTWSNSAANNVDIFSGTALPVVGAKSWNINFPAIGDSPAGFAWTIFNAEHTALLNLEISALEADGNGKTLANPRVVTSDKQQAVIEQGTELPYTTVQGTASGVQTYSTVFKKVNLSLNVTPQITPNNHIILDVEVTKDSVGAISTTAGAAINTKHVKTQVLVENGGTLVIGGIYEDNSSGSNSKVPYLSQIPVFGKLFQSHSKHHSRSELMIFITPRVIHENGHARVLLS